MDNSHSSRQDDSEQAKPLRGARLYIGLAVIILTVAMSVALVLSLAVDSEMTWEILVVVSTTVSVFSLVPKWINAIDRFLTWLRTKKP